VNLTKKKVTPTASVPKGTPTPAAQIPPMKHPSDMSATDLRDNMNILQASYKTNGGWIGNLKNTYASLVAERQRRAQRKW
jgi:hypothetical protein